MGDESPEFICLSYLLNEYGFIEDGQVENLFYFSKNNSQPIRVNMLKRNYIDLELSSYAILVNEETENFISKFNWGMENLKKFSKD